MTKDARLTIRFEPAEIDQLEAVAAEEDVSVGHLVRRAVKMMLAGTAALVAVLTISACGSQESPTATQSAPQVPAVAQVQGAAPEPSVSESATCWSITTAQTLVDRFNAMPDVNVDPASAKAYYQDLLGDFPTAMDSYCTPDDARIAARLRDSLNGAIIDADATIANRS